MENAISAVQVTINEQSTKVIAELSKHTQEQVGELRTDLMGTLLGSMQDLVSASESQAQAQLSHLQSTLDQQAAAFETSSQDNAMQVK